MHKAGYLQARHYTLHSTQGTEQSRTYEKTLDLTHHGAGLEDSEAQAIEARLHGRQRKAITQRQNLAIYILELEAQMMDAVYGKFF